MDRGIDPFDLTTRHRGPSEPFPTDLYGVPRNTSWSSERAAANSTRHSFSHIPTHSMNDARQSSANYYNGLERGGYDHAPGQLANLETGFASFRADDNSTSFVDSRNGMYQPTAGPSSEITGQSNPRKRRRTRSSPLDDEEHEGDGKVRATGYISPNGYHSATSGRQQSTKSADREAKAQRTGSGEGAESGASREVKSGNEKRVRPGRGKGMRRGARACTNCRKGKNRCEGDHPCNRCAAQGLECIFAKPDPKPPIMGDANMTSSNPSDPYSGYRSSGGWDAGNLDGRFMHIENSVHGLAATQGHMQSMLAQILHTLSNQSQLNPSFHSSDGSPYPNLAAMTGLNNSFPGLSTGPMQPDPQSMSANIEHQAARTLSSSSHTAMDQHQQPSTSSLPVRDQIITSPRAFPKLPGFKPPPHRFAHYGLVTSSTAVSSEDESEETLPRSSLNAPIEALHQLANAADQAAKDDAQREAQLRGAYSPPSNVTDSVAKTLERDKSTHQQAIRPDISNFLSPPRVLAGNRQVSFKKQKKPDPAPRNAFPDVITKGLVPETEARQLWDL